MGMTNETVVAILSELKKCYLGGIVDALDFAIETLKEQEPRVMTLEEVKQWCEIHPHKQNPIWVEFQHRYGTNGWRVGLVNSGLLAWCRANEARCWTSKPSDTQRKAAKWE